MNSIRHHKIRSHISRLELCDELFLTLGFAQRLGFVVGFVVEDEAMWNSNCLIIAIRCGWVCWERISTLLTMLCHFTHDSKEPKVSLLKSFLLGKCMSCCYNTKFISFSPFFRFQLANFVPRMKSMLPEFPCYCVSKFCWQSRRHKMCVALVQLTPLYRAQLITFINWLRSPNKIKRLQKLNSFVFVLENSSSFMTPSFLFAWRLNPQKDLWLFVQHFFCCFDILLCSLSLENEGRNKAMRDVFVLLNISQDLPNPLFS